MSRKREVAAPPPQTLDLRQVEPARDEPKRQMGRRWVVGGAAGVVGVAAAVICWRLLSGQPDPIPQSVREAAVFPLYYSRQLPSGFSVLEGEAPKLVGGVATLEYSYQSHTVVVSMQAKPSANLPEPLRLKDVDLSFGHGYVANINGQPAGIVEGDKTLIFITSEDKLDADVIAQFMRSLVPAS